MLAGMAAAQAPTTRPTEDRISQLITKLGDDDFNVRQEAQEELRKMGQPALPALREAAKSADPEVSSRAESLLTQIEEPARAGRQDNEMDLPGMNGIIVGPGGMRQEIRFQVVGPNAVRNMTVRENGRTTTIHEDANGIQMTVTEPGKDGRPETKEYKAANAEELKKKDPDASRIYERLKAKPMHMPRMQLRMNGMPPEMQRMLRENDRRLARLMDATPNADRFGIEAADADMALKAQLGHGAVVQEVQPDSRAAKLGVKRHDLIQKVNEKQIESAEDLEDALGGEGPVTIEVMRGGKSVKLQEEK